MNTQEILYMAIAIALLVFVFGLGASQERFEDEVGAPVYKGLGRTIKSTIADLRPKKKSA